MGNISETGHATNIGKFKELIDLNTSFGPDYNPTNPRITVANMTIQWNAAAALETSLNEALTNVMIPINDREALFTGLNKTLTRALNYYGSSGTIQKNIDNAKCDTIKIRGGKKEKKNEEEGNDIIKRISNSHRSSLQKTENLEKLILFYEEDTTYYKPNEADLKTTALRTTLATIKGMNSSISLLLRTIVPKRIARNEALYNKGDGIIDVALACKKYIRGLYGANSQQARAAGKIQLKRFMKMDVV